MSVIITVPCQGSEHRILWPENGPVQLLDHDPRLYHVEKHLARACGDMKAVPSWWGGCGPARAMPTNCHAALAAIRTVLILGSIAKGEDAWWAQLEPIVAMRQSRGGGRFRPRHVSTEALRRVWPAHVQRMIWQDDRDEARALESARRAALGPAPSW